jgi:hypothetical protein
MRTRLAWCFLILCAAWYTYDTILTQFPDNTGSDFQGYYSAARHVLHGRSPFLEDSYIYPPLLALLMAPLGALSYLAARWVWFVFSQACLLWAAWLVYRYLGRGLVAACLVALVWAGGRSGGEAVGVGQLGPELALLLAIAYTAADWRQGASLGLGIALKFLPGPCAIGLAMARCWRALWVAILCSLLGALFWVFASFALAGPPAPPHPTSFLAGTPVVLSWSLPSVAQRIMDPPAPGHGLPWPNAFQLYSLNLPPAARRVGLAVTIATFALGIGALLAMTRGRVSRAQLPIAMACLTTLTLVAAPVSWTHYQVMQYPGVALFAGGLALRGAWKKLGWSLLCAAFIYPIPVAVLRAMAAASGDAWPNTPMANYFWISVAPVAGLVLYGMMVAEIKRGGADDRFSSSALAHHPRFF